MTNAIEARGLTKDFGDKRALAGVDISVPAGTVTAVLGPNGAGKTTAVRILTTLSTPTAGTARVAGRDVLTEPREVRRRIGFTAQDVTVDENLTGLENLEMVGQLFGQPIKAARARGLSLLEQFSLTDAANKRAGQYSGGMRRRLDLATTLMGDPEVLFLDEPTTGLDPRARLELWGVLETLVGSGVTLLLTTQYLEEAERLADDILVVDNGRIIAQGDPRSLKRQVGGDQVAVTVADGARLAEVGALIETATGSVADLDRGSNTATAPTDRGVKGLGAVVRALEETDIAVEDVRLQQPTLDEVFLKLTGHRASDADLDDSAEARS